MIPTPMAALRTYTFTTCIWVTLSVQAQVYDLRSPSRIGTWICPKEVLAYELAPLDRIGRAQMSRGSTLNIQELEVVVFYVDDAGTPAYYVKSNFKSDPRSDLYPIKLFGGAGDGENQLGRDLEYYLLNIVGSEDDLELAKKHVKFKFTTNYVRSVGDDVLYWTDYDIEIIRPNGTRVPHGKAIAMLQAELHEANGGRTTIDALFGEGTKADLLEHVSNKYGTDATRAKAVLGRHGPEVHYADPEDLLTHFRKVQEECEGTVCLAPTSGITTTYDCGAVSLSLTAGPGLEVQITVGEVSYQLFTSDSDADDACTLERELCFTFGDDPQISLDRSMTCPLGEIPLTAGNVNLKHGQVSVSVEF